MLVLVSYKKEIKVFRGKKKEVYVPIYKDIGKGGSPNRYSKDELKRET